MRPQLGSAKPLRSQKRTNGYGFVLKDLDMEKNYVLWIIENLRQQRRCFWNRLTEDGIEEMSLLFVRNRDTRMVGLEMFNFVRNVFKTTDIELESVGSKRDDDMFTVVRGIRRFSKVAIRWHTQNCMKNKEHAQPDSDSTADYFDYNNETPAEPIHSDSGTHEEYEDETTADTDHLEPATPEEYEDYTAAVTDHSELAPPEEYKDETRADTDHSDPVPPEEYEDYNAAVTDHSDSAHEVYYKYIINGITI